MCIRDRFKAVDRSLEEGRMQVARIVGRDTSALSAQEVRTAALETLAENLKMCIRDSLREVPHGEEVGGRRHGRIHGCNGKRDSGQRSPQRPHHGYYTDDIGKMCIRDRHVPL